MKDNVGLISLKPPEFVSFLACGTLLDPHFALTLSLTVWLTVASQGCLGGFGDRRCWREVPISLLRPILPPLYRNCP